MPPKLAPLVIALIVLGFITWRATHNTRKMVEATIGRRSNPSREEFLEQMASDVSPATAEFLWATILPYVAPKLAPHPDDHLWQDLPIDEGDVTMDWPKDFAKIHGRNLELWPDWPKDLPVTVRNFGRWLESGLA